MNVSCDNCGTKYVIDENKVPKRGGRITCKNCSFVFTVYHPDVANTVAETSEDAPQPASETVAGENTEDFSVEISADIPPTAENVEDMDVHSLNFQKVGLQAWKVKIKMGLVYDFSDYRTLKKYIREGKVENTDLLSYDGKNWRPLNEIIDGDNTNLERYFCEIYLLKKREMEDAPVASETAETPADSTASSTAPTIAPSIANDAGAGLGDLASAIADAEADISGNTADQTVSNPYAARRSSSKPRKRKRAKPVEPKKSSNNWLIGIAAIVLLGVGVWYTQRTPEQATETVTQTTTTKPQNKKANAHEKNLRDHNRQKLRDELEASAQKMLADAPEAKNKKLDEDVAKPALRAVVPEEFRNPNVKKKEQPKAFSVTEAEPSVDYRQQGDRAAKSQKWSQAATAYQKAARASGGPVVQEKWGHALYKAGNKAQAKPILQKAAQAGSVQANKWLGYIARDEGDIAKSNQYFHKYLQSKPADSAVIQRVMSGG